MTNIKYPGPLRTIYGIGLAVAVFVAGCAGIPAPTEQMAVS